MSFEFSVMSYGNDERQFPVSRFLFPVPRIPAPREGRRQLETGNWQLETLFAVRRTC
jgi:hypothetical protein